MSDRLFVTTCVFNPEQYKSRYRLYFQFVEYMKQFKNIELWTIELAFHDRPYVVTEAGNERHIQMRTSDILWYKENLLNILIKKLPPGATYISWMDADIHFKEKDWVEKTLHSLKQYKIVQMFEKADDLNARGDVDSSEFSFIYRWKHGRYVIPLFPTKSHFVKQSQCNTL